MYKIKLIPKESIKSIIPLAALLNPNLTEEILIKRLDMMMEMNYECLPLYNLIRKI